MVNLLVCMAGLLGFQELSAQPILVLADQLNYTFRVPKTSLPSSETGFDKVFVRVGANPDTTEPILEFSGNGLSEELVFTRTLEPELEGSVFRIQVTRQRFNVNNGTVAPGDVSSIGQSEFVVGLTQGVLSENTTWTENRRIEGFSFATRLFGGVHVPKDITLTIGPGVVVDGFDSAATGSLQRKAPLLVEGNLIVQSGAKLKSLNINSEAISSARQVRQQQTRLVNAQLEDVIADLHGDGVVMDGVRILDTLTRITVRPAGDGAETRIQNSVFTQPLTVAIPKGEGSVPGKLVIGNCEFGTMLEPVFTDKTLLIQSLPMEVEVLDNLFRGGGIQLVSSEGLGFTLRGNRSSAPGQVPPFREPSGEFAVRITQEGVAEPGARRIETNNGIGRLDVWADGVTVRNNEIILSSLQNQGGVIAGVYVAGSDCVVDGNQITGTRGDALQDIATTGILMGGIDFSNPRPDGVLDFNRNVIRNNKISNWGRGIHLRSGGGHQIVSNEIFSNWQNFVLGHERADLGPQVAAENLFAENHLHSFLGPDNSELNSPGNFRAYGTCQSGLCGIRFSDSVGNLWSDYAGEDVNQDGVGDTPHVLGQVGDEFYADPLPIVVAGPRKELVVNQVGDEEDADVEDGVADIDLSRPGLQTTLRAAIQTANANAGPDVIVFDFTGDGGPTTGTPLIRPKTRLPAILEALTVDGGPRPGEVQIDGSDLPEFNPALGGPEILPESIGLRVFSPDPVILRGLSLTGFSIGIGVFGGLGHEIQECFIGLTPQVILSGAEREEIGIFVLETEETRITETTVGFYKTGILVKGSDQGRIDGNFIGFTARRVPVPNGIGILLEDSTRFVVGGSVEEEGNLLAGNDIGLKILRGGDNPAGAPVAFPATGSHEVRRNWIGTHPQDQDNPNFGNRAQGIQLLETQGNQIRENVIVHNGKDGIASSSGEGGEFLKDNVILSNSIRDNRGLGINSGLLESPSDSNPPQIQFGLDEQQRPVLRDRIAIKYQNPGREKGNRVLFQIFANEFCDPSHFGEGESLIGETQADISSDPQQAVEGDFLLPLNLDSRFFSATATVLNGNGEPIGTSEFGNCLGGIVVNITEDLSDALPGDGIADVDLATEGLQTSLRAALQTARELEGVDTILFDVIFVQVREVLDPIDHTVRMDGRVLSNPQQQVQIFSSKANPFAFVAGSEGSILQSIALGGNELPLVSVTDVESIEVDGATLLGATNLGSPSGRFALVSAIRASKLKIRNSRFSGGSRTLIELIDCVDAEIGGEIVQEGIVIPQGNIFQAIFDANALIIQGEGSLNNKITHNRFQQNILILNVKASVQIQNARDTLIQRNLFHQVAVGVSVEGAGARENRVQNNQFVGQSPFAMKVGVWIQGNASDNVIGASNIENVGLGNVFDGVDTPIGISSGTGNRLLGNRFIRRSFRKSLLIDLGFNVDDPNLRSGNDADPGPVSAANRLQNFPELLFLNPEDGTVFGELVSEPNKNYLVEVLGDLGAKNLGFVEVTTDDEGRGLFQFTPEAPNGLVNFIATDASGNSSEVSPTRLFYLVNSTRDGQIQRDLKEDGLNLTGQEFSGAPERSLRAALGDARDISFADAEATSIVFFRIPQAGEDSPSISIREPSLPFILHPVRIGGPIDAELAENLRSKFKLGGDYFATNPGVILDGSAAGASGQGLVVFEARKVTLQDLEFRNFPHRALLLEKSFDLEVNHCRFEGNGTKEPGARTAIEIIASEKVFIGEGGLIANNAGDGIRVKDSLRVVIQDCQVLGNRNGIQIFGKGLELLESTIQNNFIGGNRGNGIDANDCSGLLISGNRIGLEIGNVVRGNLLSGIAFRGVSQRNIIGGRGNLEGNLIGGNVNFGVFMLGEEIRLNQIVGNQFGDVNGGIGVANQTGIRLVNGKDNQIGGPQGFGNQFFHHPGSAIELVGSAEAPVERNLIQGNTFRGNTIGVLLDQARNNRIGPDALQSDELANDFQPGHASAIQVVSGQDNVFSKNRFVGNVEAIELQNNSHGALLAPRILGVSHNGQFLEVRVVVAQALNGGGSPGISGLVDFEVFVSDGKLLSPILNYQDANAFVGADSISNSGGNALETKLVINAPNVPGELLSLTATVEGLGTSPISNCLPVLVFDTDGDGASDAEEEAVSPGSSTMPNVSVIPGFDAQGNSVGSVRAEAVSFPEGAPANFTQSFGRPITQAPVPPPDGVEFPPGFLSFVVEVGTLGGSAEISLKLPEGFRFNCLYKLGRRVPGGAFEWFCLTEDQARFDFAANEWRVFLTDGQIGDFDLETDLFIKDPLAVAFDPEQPPLPSPVQIHLKVRADGHIEIFGTGNPQTSYLLESRQSFDPGSTWQSTGAPGFLSNTEPLATITPPVQGSLFFRLRAVE